MENALYDGTALYGRINAIFGGIIGGLIVLITLGVGLWLLIKQPIMYHDANNNLTTDPNLGITKVDPSNVRLAGILMILISLIIGGLIGGYVYATMRYKPFASITGGVQAVSDIANIFR